MQRAEFCAYCNCVMDRATLDATLSAAPGTHAIRARPALGGHEIKLTDEQFHDLITVHLADWLEQVVGGPLTQQQPPKETLMCIHQLAVSLRGECPLSIHLHLSSKCHALCRWSGRQGCATSATDG